MSLLSREIELYDFFMGDRHWRYTDIDRDAVVEGVVYSAARGLKRTSRLMQSPEQTKNTLEIAAPLNLGVLSLFRPAPPMARLHIRLRQVRVSDGLVRNAWSGIVAAVSETEVEATIRAQTLMAAVGANGCRRCWQVPCPLSLYSRGVGACNVLEEDFRTAGIVARSDGLTLQASAFAAKPDGWFKRGFVRWYVDGEPDVRYIVSHVADTLTLLTPASIPTGTAIDGFAGCDQTLTMCDEKFGNALHYGGQHTMPKSNPYGDDPVF